MSLETHNVQTVSTLGSKGPTSLLAGLATMAILAGTTAVASAQTEIRIATLAPEGSKWMQVLSKGAEEVKTVTAGRVTAKYFAGGVQGDEKDAIRKINLGQLDGAAVTAVGLSMIDESIRVLELPMMFKNIAELDYVADKMWPYFKKKFDGKGWLLQERGEVGWVHFMSKDKVESLADLKKAKMWLWGDDTLVKTTFKKIGINGVPLGVAEVDPNLGGGRLSAVYSSPLAAVALQWYTKVKFMTSMPMSFAIGATVVKKESLAKMSEEDRKAVEGVSKKSSKTLRKAVRKENANAEKTMTRKGVTVVQTPPAMVAEFQTHAEAVWKELAGKMYSQAELDMVLKYREEYRAKNPAK